MVELAKKRWYFLRTKEMVDFIPWDEIDSVIYLPAMSMEFLSLFRRVATDVKVIFDKDKGTNKRRNVQSYIINDGREGISVAEFLLGLGAKPDYIVSRKGPVIEICAYDTIGDSEYQEELRKAFGKKCCIAGNCKSGKGKCECASKK